MEFAQPRRARAGSEQASLATSLAAACHRSPCTPAAGCRPATSFKNQNGQNNINFFHFSFPSQQNLFFSRACAWRGNPKRPRLLGRKLTIKNAHHVAGRFIFLFYFFFFFFRADALRISWENSKLFGALWTNDIPKEKGSQGYPRKS